MPNLSKKQLIIVLVVVILTVAVTFSYCSKRNTNTKKVVIPVTTTTLPPKNAQACEFLTDEALLAGGIVADVKPITSDDTRRCTFEDISKEINYITLYVDDVSQCDVLFANTKDKVSLPEVSPSAIYSDESDPTIIVSLGTRCFFVQGSKTLVTKESLTLIAKEITQLFTAIDSTTTTTTTLPGETTAPPAGPTLPGQNTVVVTTVPPPPTVPITETKKKP